MHSLSACRHPAQLRLFACTRARTLAVIKLLTLLCLSLFDKTASLQKAPCDYRHGCNGRPRHTQFTCLVSCVWHPGPTHTHTPDDATRLLMTNPSSECCPNTRKKRKRREKKTPPDTALSELPSQNYTPLPCNRPKRLNCKRFVLQLITGQLRRLNILLHGNTKNPKR